MEHFRILPGHGRMLTLPEAEAKPRLMLLTKRTEIQVSAVCLTESPASSFTEGETEGRPSQGENTNFKYIIMRGTETGAYATAQM